MLEIFKKMRAGPVSAQALREARAALDPHAVERTVAKREEARREAILCGDPKEITRAEAALADARMEAERIAIALEELENRIAEADRREADEAVQVRVREIEGRRDALRKRVMKELAPALRTASGILSEIAALDEEIEATNRDLSSKGRPEAIATTEDGVTPFPEGHLREVWTLHRTTVLRPISSWGVAGWNWPSTSPA